MDEEPVGADAGLPGVEEFDQRRPFGCVHRVGVGEDQERRVAPQFEGDPLQLVGGPPCDLLADLGGAGEADFSHQRVAEELVRHGHRVARGHQVDDARRKTRGLQDAERLDRAQGGPLRGLEHHGAAGRRGGRDLAGQHGDRVVPRSDGRGHADRLAQH
jgi:hypothetical protein